MSISEYVRKEQEKGIDKACDRLVPRGAPTYSLGAKFDAGKLMSSLLFEGFAQPLKAVAAVLTYGAIKYAANSWQHVPDARARYSDALYRHQTSRAEGEVYDEESGLPHRAHEICNNLFLLWFDIKDGIITNLTKFNDPIASQKKEFYNQ